MTPPDLNVALIQTDIHWQDIDANLEMFDQKVASIKDADLIVLPEMFSTGFTMETHIVSEPMEGKALAWMKEAARSSSTVITGSLIIEEDGKYFNRMIWMRPDGSFEYYDKRHLFRMAKEEAYFSSGNERLIVELNGWKIHPLVCYDLRFPVWSRNRYSADGNKALAEYDVLIYAANWPAVRINAWDILIQARAVENQCYCLGLNRVGIDGNDKEYVGHTAAVDAKGHYLMEPLEKEEAVTQVRLNWNALQEFREKFPQGLDADRFELLD